MHLYLPIALTSVNIFLIVGLGLMVGLLSGLFGVGGGFLMTPLLIMIGIPPTVAAATDANQIVAASSSGVIAHWRLGNVDFKMGLLLLIGGFTGGALGVHIIKVLKAMGNANFLIKITYVVMLGLVGGFMFVESLMALRKSKQKNNPGATAISSGEFLEETKKTSLLSRLPFQVYFEKSGVSHSVIVPIALGMFVGILAAIMGVGGGFLMVPVMLYFLRMPMHVVVGTSLFQIMFTCTEVTFLQAYTNHTVDFILAILLLLGSTFGAQIGARIGRRLKGDQLKILLSIIVLAITIKMLLSIVMKPDILLSYKGGH
ncbi:protein of unknown function DUF81 [Thermodesulfatator indicus DSM 15286]|uniref:Probable membrane transporter protein n=1 Tax=Thermodesulfatator indicus (strain DSM 15286 / JCM 11887 / CIR29812) TaxID=667014 RepID=F8AD42_THEID|nr:sulfite exporter TauE/SafE family protein [Thermodesulfatator indicus]AEH45917.1 protein of unknown function DUF81 [Thermodesulfatator indicus DSM 15286]